MNKPQGNFAGVALWRTFEIRWFPQKPTGRWEDDPLVKPRAGEELKGLNWCQPQPRVDRSQTSSTCSSGIISDKMDQSSIYSKSCMVLSWFREKFYRDWVRASLAASWKALPVTLAHGLVSLRILNSRLGDIPHFQTHQITIFISIYIYIYPIVSWWLIVSDTPKSKELIINILLLLFLFLLLLLFIIIIDYWLWLIIIIYICYIMQFFHDIPGSYFQILGVAMPISHISHGLTQALLTPSLRSLTETRQRRDFCRRGPHNYVSELGKCSQLGYLV